MIPESLVDPDINPELVLTPKALQQAGFERRKGIWCPMDRVQRSGITVDEQNAARIRVLFDSPQRQVHRSLSGSEITVALSLEFTGIPIGILATSLSLAWMAYCGRARLLGGDNFGND
jgi:hypothetical protein